MNGKVKTFVTWHHVKGARIADISCVLLHYPFVSTFHQKVQDAVQTGRYGMRVTDEYKAYAKALSRYPNLTLKLPTARMFNGSQRLIEENFLVVSEKYRRWVSDHAQEIQVSAGHR